MSEPVNPIFGSHGASEGRTYAFALDDLFLIVLLRNGMSTRGVDFTCDVDDDGQATTTFTLNGEEHGSVYREVRDGRRVVIVSYFSLAQILRRREKGLK